MPNVGEQTWLAGGDFPHHVHFDDPATFRLEDIRGLAEINLNAIVVYKQACLCRKACSAPFSPLGSHGIQAFLTFPRVSRKDASCPHNDESFRELDGSPNICWLALPKEREA